MKSAPKNISINKSSFNKLIKAIRLEIAQGKKDVEGRLAKMYWRIGKHISKDILENKERAGYGDKLFDQLSIALKTPKTTLHNAVKFHNTHQIIQTSGQLKWSHYEVLLTVADKRKRLRLEASAKKKKMTVPQLKKRVQKIRQAEKLSKAVDAKNIPKLALERGELYCFKVINSLTGDKGELTIDCGFNISRDVPFINAGSFKPGDILKSEKANNGFAAKRKEISKAELYTYKAYLERVIDGDTISVNIDCGFKTSLRQKLRFRSINTPEVKTAAGKRAKQFVQDALGPLDFFVIKTYGFGKYDRALVDVFYLPGEKDAQKIAKEGVLLNQQLLDRGLAELWKDAGKGT